MALVSVGALALGACDSGDGRELADPAVPFTEPVTTTTVPGVRQFTRGTATLVMDDDRRFDFTITSCFVGEQEASGISLQVEAAGTSPDGESMTLSLVRTEPREQSPERLETVSIRFGGSGSLPDRAWESQRTIAESGEVTDLHGDATVALFDVTDEEVEVEVRAADATYWQFGFGTVESGPVGVGTLDVTCT